MSLKQLLLLVMLATSLMPSGAVRAGHDILLALDRSLSMNNSDPSRESLAGAELLIDLLDAEDRLALLSFGQSVEQIVPLSTLDQSREQILARVRQIRMDGTRTDFEAVLREAYQHLSHHSSGSDSQLILFSDGQLNLGNEAADRDAHAAILTTWLPRFAASGVRIHGVAFSPQADLELLNTLAEATGGKAFRVTSPEDLQAAFLRLFEQVSPPISLPVIDGQVLVDANVDTLNLLIPSRPGAPSVQLTTPGNEHLQVSDARENLDWKQRKRFDHITIAQPMAGYWKVEGGSDTPRAYVETDLDLALRLPVLALVDEDVDLMARLLYKGAVLDASAETLGEISVVGDISEAGGTLVEHLVLKASDQTPGLYKARTRFGALGEYEVTVIARAGDVERMRSAYLSIVEPSAPSETQRDADGRPLPFWLQGDTSGTTSRQQSASDAAPHPPAQREALTILLLANVIIVVVGGVVVGIWWSRRRRRARDADAGSRS